MIRVVKFRTLYGGPMPTYGKDHGNPEGRTLAGLSGFLTESGHFLTRAWGREGMALCGATVRFDEDPVRPALVRQMAACCNARLARIARRLGDS